jgi:hypothetical protein
MQGRHSLYQEKLLNCLMGLSVLAWKALPPAKHSIE